MKFRSYALSALFMLAACDQIMPKSSQPESSEAASAPEAREVVSAPETSVAPEPVHLTYFQRLMAGETLVINLDACDANDRNAWDGENDPAAREVCGTSYEISYGAEDNLILAKGLLESTDGTPHIDRAGSRDWSGQENRFNIWGTRHYMNDDGEILDKDSVLIGHIVN